MKKSKLKIYIFMALCCSMGMFAKKLVNPFANIITDYLRIPGGISTAFSIMFLVVAREICGIKWCGTMMGLVQGALALAMGRVGSMGIFMPLGYIVPGVVIDLVSIILDKTSWTDGTEKAAVINMLASLSAAMTANALVFRLWGVVLVLYGAVASISGLCFGILGAELIRIVRKAIK